MLRARSRRLGGLVQDPEGETGRLCAFLGVAWTENLLYPSRRKHLGEDAMVSDRPYSAAMPVTTALGELRGGAGTQFDPDVIEVVEWALANEYVIPHAGYGLSTT